MLRKIGLFVVVLALLMSLASVAFAQDMEVVASGLNSPRQLFYDSDGTLYIAEAGIAGDSEVECSGNKIKFGTSAQVTAVSTDGEQSVQIPELLSFDSGFGAMRGTHGIWVTEDSYWVLQGDGPCEVPEGSAVSALIEYKKDGMAMGAVIDLEAFEQENNPDQDAEVHSNPTDVAVGADGTVYIADASGNDVLSWTEADGLQLFAAWPVAEGTPQSVPSSVAVGPEGDVYVGFLGGFPFEAGSTRIEVYSADGELKATWDGLTLVTDVWVGEDGSVYAVQMASGFGDTGFIADSGSVVKVTEDGLEPVAEGLAFPYGIALSPDGDLVVSLHSTGGAAGNGEVVVIASM